MGSNTPASRWLVLLIAFLIGFTCMGWMWLSLPVFLPNIAEELGVGTARAQLLFSLISLSFVATGYLGGLLGDRYTHRWIIGIGTLIIGISGLLRGVLPGFEGLIVASLVTGLGLGIAIPNLVSLLGHWFPPDEIGLANGIRMTGERLGAAFGQGVLAGLLIQWLQHWRPAQAVLGGGALLVALIWLVFYREPEGADPGPNTAGPPASSSRPGAFKQFFRSLKKLGSDGSLMVIGFVALVYTYSWFTYLGMLPTWLGSLSFVPEGSVGLYSSIVFWALVVGGLVLPSMSDWVERRYPVLVSITLLLGVGITATGWASGRLFLTGAIIVSGLAAGGLIPMVFTMVNERIDIGSSSQSLEAGFLLSISQPGAVVGPPIGGWFFEHYGIEAAAAITAGPLLFASGLLLVQILTDR